MADIWMDVDVALSGVPVNITPLTSPTNPKSLKENLAYNAAGLELIWHFTTTAGATSATVVTPTSGGAYDWAHQDGGMYTIEIPASGGASINNDTEGFGWFTGIATDMLPWRGPIIGFRAAGLNNLLIDDAYSTTRGLAGTALPAAAADAAGGLPISDAGGLDLDTYIKRIEGAITATILGRIDAAISTRSSHAASDVKTAVEAAGSHLALIKAKTDNLPASPAAVGSAMTLADDAITAAKFDESTAFPLKSADTGATAVARTGADSDTLKTLSDEIAAVTAPTAAAVADAVWDEAIAGHAGAGSAGEALAAAGAAGDPWITPLPGAYGAGTAGKIVGDNLNATVSSRSSHDAAAVKTAIEAAGSHLALIKAKTDNLTFTVAGDVDCNVQSWKGSAAADMTGDAYARLGAPAGASVSADVAAVKSETAAIVADTNELQTDWHDGGRLDLILDGILEDTGTTLDGKIDTIDGNVDSILADTNELQTDWANGGRLDLILDAAGSAGDPWSTELPGAYGAGTAGKIVGDNLNAPVGTVDTVVDAIKAVTDNLPNSGALTDLATAAALATVDGIVDDILTDTGTTLPGTLSTMDGKLDIIDNFIDTEVAAILEDTGTTLPATLATIEGKIDTADAVADAIKAVTDAIGATGSGLSAVPWNPAWDAEVQSECADALNAYDPPTKAELDAADDAILAVLGTPAGADMAADIAALPTATENADALLNRDMSAVSDTTARSPLNALRQLRNKVAIVAGTMTVYEEDDATEAWTAALTTDASAEAITVVDPA